MTPKPNKYSTEAGLNFVLDKFIMCQCDQFKAFEKSPEHFKYLESCNIYFICRRNRIGIVPELSKPNDKSIHLTFQFWEKDKKFNFPIGFTNNFDSTQLTTVSEYPYDFFKVVNEKGENVYEAKSSFVADDHRRGILPNPDFLDFEILYIGKAMDKSAKPTFNRLFKHETLLKIYSENPPDKEIFLFLFPLFADGTIEIKGTEKNQKEFEKDDEKRLERFLNSGLKITAKQQVAVAEAALIKYFQPLYNTHHKKTFPTKRNTSYDEIYKLDFNTVSIKVTTSKIDLDFYFYSEQVKTGKTHSESYFLPTEADRRKLLDFSEDFDTDAEEED